MLEIYCKNIFCPVLSSCSAWGGELMISALGSHAACAAHQLGCWWPDAPPPGLCFLLVHGGSAGALPCTVVGGKYKPSDWPLAACPPIAWGQSSDQKCSLHPQYPQPTAVPWALCLLLQREEFSCILTLPLSSPEQFRTKSPAHVAVNPFIKFTFNYSNFLTVWKVTTKGESSLGINGK